MADCSHEEGIVPAGAFDFAAYRGLIGDRSQDVECKLSQESEILGCMVLSRPIAIFGEVNVEHPMQAVLDAPMAASDLDKSLRRHVFRQNIVADERRIGVLPSQTSSRSDPPNGCDTGKAVEFCQAGIADDRCAAGLASIVSRWFDLFCAAALPRSRE